MRWNPIPGPALFILVPTRDLLDCINLFAKELSFKEVTQMSITVGSLVQVQKTLIHSLFQFQSCFQSIKRASPFHGTGLSNVLEDDLSTSLVLILDQLLPMLPILVGGLLEEGRHARVSHIVPVEVGVHGHVHVAGVKLHVDLLVDQGLGLLLEVLSDS